VMIVLLKEANIWQSPYPVCCHDYYRPCQFLHALHGLINVSGISRSKENLSLFYPFHTVTRNWTLFLPLIAICPWVISWRACFGDLASP